MTTSMIIPVILIFTFTALLLLFLFLSIIVICKNEKDKGVQEKEVPKVKSSELTNK